MRRYVRWSSILLSFAASVVLLTSSRAIDRETRREVLAAVVQISLVKVSGEQTYYLPWGSGTIISPDGLILTNSHVADPLGYGSFPEQVPDYDYLGIALTVRSDQPPRLAYLAEVIQSDPMLDLAVVRVTRWLDGNPLRPEDLDLPYLEIADSDVIEVGDDLNVFGYPGIGGETITLTKGVVSGFTLDAAIVGRAWIKTDAGISGGNSGGTAVNDDGLLVAVPTRAGLGGSTEPVDCRPVKDTNGDGSIDGSDDCVPIGGFINALRPVNLALPLIEAARRGLPNRLAEAMPGETEQQGPAPLLTGLFFAPGVKGSNQPQSVVRSLPSGSRSMFLFFDYENMTPDMSMEMKVFIDGHERPEWGLQAGPWAGGERGLWWIGWDDAGLPDGAYEFSLHVDGEERGRASILVGGPAANVPSLSDVVLSLASDSQEPRSLFPAGTTEILVSFKHKDMAQGLTWGHSLESGEGETFRTQGLWSDKADGQRLVTLRSPKELVPGVYRLRLHIEGELAALADFWVAGGEEADAGFGPITFAEGQDDQGNPEGASSSFEPGLRELHAFTDYRGMHDGLRITTRWSVDGQPVVDTTEYWTGGEAGVWHSHIYAGSSGLSDGNYSLEVLAGDRRLASGSAEIGTQVLPTPTPGPGIRVQGNISDIDSRKAIEGATVLVLEPGTRLDSFRWTEEELHTLALSDLRGRYRLPDLLLPEQCYTIIVLAQGYWGRGEDGVCMEPSSPLTLDLPFWLESK